jgi:hypothetical protein
LPCAWLPNDGAARVLVSIGPWSGDTPDHWPPRRPPLAAAVAVAIGHRALGLVQADGSPNQGYECLRIDFIALVEVDCPASVALEA